MAQQRPITCRSNTRSYPDGNESDEARTPRGDVKARKRNSVAVRSPWQAAQLGLVQEKADLF